MRSFRLMAAAAGLAATFALPAAAQAAPRNLVCNGDGTVSGTYASIVVPENGWCNLQNATVLGNAIVLSGGTLNLDVSGSVDGDVYVGSSGWLYEDTGWVIGGTTTGNGAQDIQINGTSHSVYDKGGQGLYISQATVDGDIVANQEQNGGDIFASTVRGNVLINGTAPTDGGSWWITGDLNPADGLLQEIYGNVVITSNQVEVNANGNHIHKNLVCEANTPPPVAQGNRVDGRSVGQCASTS